MKGNLDVFDFLRGVAIILVLGYHAMSNVFENYDTLHYSGLFIDSLKTSNTQILLNISPFAFGSHGVALFLVISGFLIHYNYLAKKLPFNPLLFFNKRFWRIYPPYLIALLVFALTFNKSGFFYHLFLVHNLKGSYIFSINPSFWSLALEAQLYLIYPAYLYCYNKLGNNKAFGITVLISILSVLLRVFLGINKPNFYTNVLSYWSIWTIGAYLAHSYYRKKRISNMSASGLLVLLIGLMLLKLTVIYEYVSPYLFALFFTLIIDRLLHMQLRKTILYRSLITIGLISYSIYLFHQPIYMLTKEKLFDQYKLGDGLEITILLIITLFIILFSYITYKVLELQSIRIGNLFYKKYFSQQNVKADQIYS